MVEYSTRRVTSPSGRSFSSTCDTLAWNASPDLASISAFITVKACVWCRSLAMGSPVARLLGVQHPRVLGRGMLAAEVILRLHLPQAARRAGELALHHARRRIGLRRFGHELLGRRIGREHELHALVVEHV